MFIYRYYQSRLYRSLAETNWITRVAALEFAQWTDIFQWNISKWEHEYLNCIGYFKFIVQIRTPGLICTTFMFIYLGDCGKNYTPIYDPSKKSNFHPSNCIDLNIDLKVNTIYEREMSNFFKKSISKIIVRRSQRSENH